MSAKLMANRSDRHLLNLSNSQGTKARSPDQEKVRGFPSWPGVQTQALQQKAEYMTATGSKQSEAATLRTGLGPYMRVRIQLAPPVSPFKPGASECWARKALRIPGHARVWVDMGTLGTLSGKVEPAH